MSLDNWKDEAIILASDGLSQRAISKLLDIPRSTLGDYLKQHYLKPSVENKPTQTFSVRKSRDTSNDRVLVISDLHIPYQHPDSFEFLESLRVKYKPTRIVCMGDELDQHALSYHEHDPDLPSAGDELARSLPFIKQLHEIFPKMDVLESNHGSLIWRKTKTAGIPKHYIKSYNDVLSVGNDWKWSFDLTIELPDNSKCYFHHGKSSDVLKLSQQMGMHAIQGHYHEKFKIDYWGNPTGLYWAMQTGCLIDDESYAFNYNNVNIKRPVIGTGVIIDSQPVLEPLIMNSLGRWQKYAK